MFVVRPITASDLDALERFAAATSIGITNLPLDRHLLGEKIALSQRSFETAVTAPENELYLFVIEDLNTQTVGGTCGIFSKTGVSAPSVFFQTVKETKAPSELPVPPQIELLVPTVRTAGPSEICGLYLSPEFREGGLGRLLSLSRFLFMAAFRTRFDVTTISEMRGVIRKNNTSPFWEAVGSHFLQASFTEALEIMEKKPSLLTDFLPEHPIYTALLPPQACLAIGRSHPHTRPATRMLEKEGFAKNGEIDLLDGGPHLEAKTDEIRVIQKSHLISVKEIASTPLNGKNYLVGNERIDFRACVGQIKRHKGNRGTVTKEVAEALQVNVGDSIRIAPLHPPRGRIRQ